MSNEQGSKNNNLVLQTEIRCVQIFRREYQLPVFLSNSFQQRHKDIRQRCQLVKEGRPTFLGLSRKPLSVDESIDTLNSLMTDYQSIIDFIQEQKKSYTQFFSDLIGEIKDITIEKYQKIAELEQKRTTLARLTQQDHDLQIVYCNQQSQLLKAVQLVGSASLLMLKKLELIQGALARLADDQEVQRQVFDEIFSQMNVYAETHRLQKEIANVQFEAASMAKVAINFENIVGKYLGCLQGFIGDVTKLDQKLSIALSEINGLTDMILCESDMLSIYSDKGSSDRLLVWLTQSALKESKLTDALEDVEKQTLSAAEIELQLLLANTESDSVSGTITKIQAYLEPVFTQLILSKENKSRFESLTPQSVAPTVPVPNPALNADAYCNRGLTYFNSEDYNSAIADYNQALELDPNHLHTYINRGNAYFSSEDYHSAIADYNQALELDPNLPHIYINRGLAYYVLKDYDSAIADYNQALELDFNHLYTYINRGNAYYVLKDYYRAIADYNQALKLDPGHARAYENRGLVYSLLKDYYRAIADDNQVLELNPNNADAYCNRGLTYYVLKDYDSAIADYNQALKLDPSHARAYDNRAIAEYAKLLFRT